MKKATEELLSPKQLARRLSVPVSTLEFWRQAGKGPAYHKPGRVVRYAVEDVESWLAQRKIEPIE